VIDLDKGPEMMDRPEIIHRIFFPRRERSEDGPDGTNRFVEVAKGISLGCRFYPARKDGSNILFFHGNGETAPEYDYVAPVYRDYGLNLYVADYRGYGMSNGSPGCSHMIRDSHPVFRDFASCLRELDFTGGLYVMGRSLGSAPAIEVAHHYQEQLKGLIIESGFAGSRNQFARLGVTHLFKDMDDAVGFGNDLKIREIGIPTLIIHGEADGIIPVAEGRSLFALSGASKKLSLFVPHAGHNDLMQKALNQYMEAVAGFCLDRPFPS
jgi:alpha-beta hydrolase superfamily lysophospholipase